MHYFIDGYNMLFRLLHAGDDLQRQRESIIYELDRKISIVKLDVSLVFDATFQAGDRTRSHYNNLEILFTSEGETADEFIIDELKNSTNPRQETVVTSDKKLAWQARRRLAHTETVEDFIRRLDKSYKNKLRRKQEAERLIEQSSLISKKPQLPPPQLPPSSPSKETTADKCFSYYEYIFEAEYQTLIQLEEQKETSKVSPVKRQPRKKKKSAFEPPSAPDLKAPTEMERWLKAFEERLDFSDPYQD